MNIVVVGHYVPGYELAYYFDWRDAFLALQPRHGVSVVNTFVPGRRPASLFRRLPLPASFPCRQLRRIYAGELPCDLLVFAPSFFYFNRDRRFRFLAELVAARRGRFQTAFFVENEFRLFEEKVACARALGADLLISQFRPEVAQGYYGPRFGGAVVSCPAGVNLAVFRSLRPVKERPIDVGTRSHLYPPDLGDEDRNELLRRFLAGGGELEGLRLDVSVDPARRLPRERWAAFLNDCRATLSTEAGTTDLRWQGESTGISGKVVSSRHFEALGTRTAQLLLEGRYDDLLVPWEHYIPLRRDLGNLAEVARLVRDDGFLETLTERALRHAMDGHTYAHRVQALLARV